MTLTAIVPTPSPSPIAMSADAHRCRRRHRHRCPSILPLSINCTSVYRATAVHFTLPPICRCTIALLVNVLVGWQQQVEREVLMAAMGVPTAGDNICEKHDKGQRRRPFRLLVTVAETRLCS